MSLGMQAQKLSAEQQPANSASLVLPKPPGQLSFSLLPPPPVAATSNKPETHPANWAGDYDIERAPMCACVTPRTPLRFCSNHTNAHVPHHHHLYHYLYYTLKLMP